MDKQILILAGPNGAGKTTFAREFLVREGSCPAFLNADLIAAGLSPFDIDGNVVPPSHPQFNERTHIMYEGP